LSSSPPTFTLFPYTTLFRSIWTDGRTIYALLKSRWTVHLEHYPYETLEWHTRIPGRRLPQGSHGTHGILRRPGAIRTSRPWKKRSEEHTSELQSRENLVCRL